MNYTVSTRPFETGMYVVDNNYRIVNFNPSMGRLYPDVKVGDVCYRSVALSDEPCSVCPLRSDNALFYNPVRGEWIYANAASMEYPGHGQCYNVQFQLRQKVERSEHGDVAEEDMDEHIKSLSGGTLDVCALGGYCAPGSPLFFANSRLLELLGYRDVQQMRELTDSLVSNTIHPDDLERVTKDLTNCAENGGSFVTSYRIHHSDNFWFWIVCRGKRVETRSGQFALLCVIYDMRDYLHLQNELQSENEKLLKQELTAQAVLQHMPGGYHRCSPAPGFPFLYVSPSFEEITGWTRDEISTEFDNLFINMVLPEDVPLCSGIVDNIELYGYSNDIYRIKRKGGGYRWVSDSTMQVTLGDEHFYQGVLADVTSFITSMERQQSELKAAKQQAEESSRAKSTFLFNVSHDIRTPINAIKGFSHMIEQNVGNAPLVTDAVDKISQSSDILLQLINDVLELSRIESGKDSQELAPENLNVFSDKLYMMFAEEIGRSGICFSIDNSITHPCVMCDELKLTRVVMNMLSNARKFTPAGGQIVFGIQELGYNGKTAEYRFFVRDTGIGMSEEFMAHAFEEFEREKTSTDSGKPGSGLGLAIIKRLVNIMGGSYELKSRLGHGTEIAATVELGITDPAELIYEKAAGCNMSFKGKRMLLVEDNDFNREIAKYVFQEHGFTVDEAVNGKMCLDMLSANPESYDVVMMDVQMHVMDGYEATLAIRRHPSESIRELPVIAMTANAFREDKEKCLATGMSGHVAKPFEAEAVIKELNRVLFDGR